MNTHRNQKLEREKKKDRVEYRNKMADSSFNIPAMAIL